MEDVRDAWGDSEHDWDIGDEAHFEYLFSPKLRPSERQLRFSPSILSQRIHTARLNISRFDRRPSESCETSLVFISRLAALMKAFRTGS